MTDSLALQRDVDQFLSQRASDIMTRNPSSIRADASVEEAVAFFVNGQFSAAAVIDGRGRPLGVLSQSDIIVHLREQQGRRGLEPGALRTLVHDLMTPAVFSVGPETPVRRLLKQMADLNVHRLFVVDATGVLVGVVSASDIVHSLARTLLNSCGASPAQRCRQNQERNMKRYTLVSIAVLLVALLPGHGQYKRPTLVKEVMTEKLKNSQLLLEGLAISDFNKVSQAAERLLRLSKTAEWFVHRTPRYEMHTNEFRRAAETVIDKARARNLDGVALAYFDLTFSCIRCHQHVGDLRDARLAGLEVELALAPRRR